MGTRRINVTALGDRLEMQVLLADDHLMVREALIPFIERVAVNTTKEKSRLRAQRFVTGDNSIL